MNTEIKHPIQTPVIPFASWSLNLNKWYYEHPVQAMPNVDDIINYINESIVQPLEKKIENLEVANKLNKEIETHLNCNSCGGKLVYIRGKFSRVAKRCVCPTCSAEKLEQIHEISMVNYGGVYANKSKCEHDFELVDAGARVCKKCNVEELYIE